MSLERNIVKYGLHVLYICLWYDTICATPQPFARVPRRVVHLTLAVRELGEGYDETPPPQPAYYRTRRQLRHSVPSSRSVHVRATLSAQDGRGLRVHEAPRSIHPGTSATSPAAALLIAPSRPFCCVAAKGRPPAPRPSGVRGGRHGFASGVGGRTGTPARSRNLLTPDS